MPLSWCQQCVVGVVMVLAGTSKSISACINNQQCCTWLYHQGKFDTIVYYVHRTIEEALAFLYM